MVDIKLILSREDGTHVEDVSGRFTTADLALLDSFTGFVSRVRASSLLVRGMPAITKMRWESGKELVFECAPYSDAELHELLHVLRPLILHEEATSFDKVAALLKRCFSSRAVSDQLKLIRHIYEHGEVSRYMQVSVGGQELFKKSLLDLWLNAAQYHTDVDKAAAWRELEQSLTSPNTRALVMTQLQDRVKALFNLDYIVGLVLSKSHHQTAL